MNAVVSHLFAKTGPVNFDFDKFKFKLYNKQRKQKSLVIGSVQRRSDSNIIIHKSTPTIFFLIFPSEVFHSRTLFNYLYLNKSLSIVDGLQLGRDSLNPHPPDLCLNSSFQLAWKVSALLAQARGFKLARPGCML